MHQESPSKQKRQRENPILDVFGHAPPPPPPPPSSTTSAVAAASTAVHAERASGSAEKRSRVEVYRTKGGASGGGDGQEREMQSAPTLTNVGGYDSGASWPPTHGESMTTPPKPLAVEPLGLRGPLPPANSSMASSSGGGGGSANQPKPLGAHALSVAEGMPAGNGTSGAVESQSFQSFVSNSSGRKGNEENEEGEYDDDDGSDGSGSSIDERESTGEAREEREKRYPFFTKLYAAKFTKDVIPFVRVQLVPAASLYPPSPSLAAVASDVQMEEVTLYSSYRMLRVLGKGTFSKVVLAQQLLPIPPTTSLADGTTVAVSAPPGPTVALKIFRDEADYHEACWEEVAVLRSLCSPPGQAGGGPLPSAPTAVEVEYYARMGHFLPALDYIPHPHHPAIVLPCVGPSLLGVLLRIRSASRSRVRRLIAAEDRQNRRVRGERHEVWLRGLPLSLFRTVIYQTLLFLKYIHERGVVHTDLKPENILFESTHVIAQRLPIARLERTVAAADPAVESAGSMATVPSSGPPTREGNDIAKMGSPGHTDTEAFAKTQSLRDYWSQTLFRPLRNALVGPDPVEAAAAAAKAAEEEEGDSETEAPPKDRYVDKFPRVKFTVDVSLPLVGSIRVIDLGAAQFTVKFTKTRIDVNRGGRRVPFCYDPIQTTHYRSPEVLLNLGWDSSADIFSLGCMIPELLTGECLFMPNDTLEHLALMEHVIGPFRSPTAKGKKRAGAEQSATNDVLDFFATNAVTYEHYFHGSPGQLKWPVTEEILHAHEKAKSAKSRQTGRQLRGVTEDDSESAGRTKKDHHRYDELHKLEITDEKDIRFVKRKATIEDLLLPIHPQLLDLCKAMLRYHPQDRITAEEALQHPFFQPERDQA